MILRQQRANVLAKVELFVTNGEKIAFFGYQECDVARQTSWHVVRDIALR